jgi:hypothetical protein
MTGQISDGFRYQDRDFDIAGISDVKSWFWPSQLGLEPVAPCSACWQGFYARFAISDSRLVLDQLHIFLAGKNYSPKNGPSINGVKPKGQGEGNDWFNNHYLDLGYPLKYTGKLLVGANFIHALYVHMGTQLSWKYEEVHELVFKEGVLVEAYDRSEQMVALRQENIRREAENDGADRVFCWPNFTGQT